MPFLPGEDSLVRHKFKHRKQRSTLSFFALFKDKLPVIVYTAYCTFPGNAPCTADYTISNKNMHDVLCRLSPRAFVLLLSKVHILYVIGCI